jgi:hypothetical protein
MPFIFLKAIFSLVRSFAHRTMKLLFVKLFCLFVVLFVAGSVQSFPGDYAFVQKKTF